MSIKGKFNEKSISDEVRELTDEAKISSTLLKAIQYNNQELVAYLFKEKQAESSSIHLSLAAQLANDEIFQMIFDKTEEYQRDLSLSSAIHNGYVEAIERLIKAIDPEEDFEVSTLFAEAALHDQKQSFFALCRLGFDAGEAHETMKETLIFGINARYDAETIEKMHRYYLFYMELTRDFHMDLAQLHQYMDKATDQELFNSPENRPETSPIAFLAARANLFDAFATRLIETGKKDLLTDPKQYEHKDHSGHSLTDILIEKGQINSLFNKEIWNNVNKLEQFHDKVIHTHKQHLVDIQQLCAFITRDKMMRKKASTSIRLRKRR